MPELTQEGEEVTIKNPQGREKFGTFTRESATGLDYAVERYYSSGFGRFTAADRYHQTMPSASDRNAPGSWNQYGYAGGDPVNSADPTGTVKITCDSPASSIYDGSCNISNGLYGYYGAMGCGIDGSYGFRYNLNSIVPCLFAAQAGGGGGTGHAAPAPPPTPPQCFAQLKDRPVNDPNAAKVGAVHTFWWVKGVFDGLPDEFILSAGPTKTSPTYLNAYATPGDDNGSGDNSSQHLDWSSGSSANLCAQINNMIGAAQVFPNNQILYRPVGVFGYGGPNSNSFSHYVQGVAGFFLLPPITAYGWYTNIQFPN